METQPENNLEKTSENDSKPWLFKEGNPGGPGAPKLTEEEKAIKKATREMVREYKERLADALPKISPVLIDKAVAGDMAAIREINTIIVGKAPTELNLGGQAENPIRIIEVVIENESSSF